MNAKYTLVPEAIATFAATDKSQILQTLSALFARSYGLDKGVVLDGLEERERLGSTGFGRGVAIPHARIEGINRPLAAILRLDGSVDFEAADALPVDLVIGLLSPVNAGATHLHALAAISRMVRDDETHEALLQAADSEALYAMLTNATDRDAA